MNILIFLVTAVIVPMLVSEFTDWLPWFAARLIGATVRTLPYAVRSRYAEEWLAELDDVPGKLSKLAFAIRVLARAPSMAAAIRGVPPNGANSVSADLSTAFSELMGDKSALYGLRINSVFGNIPPSLPTHVTEALTAATGEALNNIARHADVNEAWINAVGDGRGGVSVTVFDRGMGFDPDIVHYSFGLIRSIKHRVIEAGGIPTINSAPGRGTIVDMSWSP